MTIDNFSRSQQFLQQALKTVPLGSQTFSKSMLSLPQGVSPYFAERGEGCELIDVDGNRYLDFMSALLCISLGYGDKDVNQAVIEQVQAGAIFSLPHRLEFEVAELLCELIPCAEMVRFGKNGSDATSAAIRLARAYTGKDHVAVCGYHGWQDWYIGSTSRNLGVPGATKALTHPFGYNDIDSLKTVLESHQGEFAAVILEPMNLSYPTADFLQKVKDLTHQHGALLIFDETITGFRFSLGGAQQLFDVTPDLATFGKGMANGYPISAVVGRADVMALMTEIFFSGTFGGDTMALAASKACIEKIRSENALGHIHQLGEDLLNRLDKLIDSLGINHLYATAGHPSWSFLVGKDGRHFDAWTIKTYWLQELFARGIITNGSHNLNFAHQPKHIDMLLDAYGDILAQIKHYDDNGTLDKQLRCPVLKPIFKVR